MFKVLRDIRNLKYDFSQHDKTLDEFEKRISELEKHNKFITSTTFDANIPFGFRFAETSLRKIVLALIKYLDLNMDNVNAVEPTVKFTSTRKDE